MPNFRLARSVLTFNQTFRRAAGSCYPTNTRARSTRERAKRSHSNQPSIASNKRIPVRSTGGILRGITRHAKVGGCRGRSDRSERHLKDIGSSPFPPEGRVSMNYAKVIGIIIGTTGHPLYDYVLVCVCECCEFPPRSCVKIGLGDSVRVWMGLWEMVSP